MEIEEFNQKLTSTAEKLNIILDDKKVEKFFAYMNFLIEKNKVMNLTSIVEPNDIILKHFIDSLTVSKYIKEDDSIIDVGTGAGFPGIPLKIESESRKITLLDSLNKRINFLNEVIEKLEFNETNAEHNRAEDAGKKENKREKFDIAISRAVAPLNVLVEYLIPFVKIGGKCICMKGNDTDEEIEKAKNAIKILGGEIEKIEKIKLPDTDNNRTIIVIKKIKETRKKISKKSW